jgi:Glycosyl transferase family 2
MIWQCVCGAAVKSVFIRIHQQSRGLRRARIGRGSIPDGSAHGRRALWIAGEQRATTGTDGATTPMTDGVEALSDAAEDLIQLSVVVPIYNEQAILLDNLSRYAGALDRIVGASRWRFILVDNGSTDSTPDMIAQVGASWPLTQTLFKPEPNYGRAVRTGLENVTTPYAHLIDVEQWDVPFLSWAWKHRDRYDLFIASKRSDPSLNRQPRYRYILSWGLNALLQLLFDFTGTETHGPKMMRMRNMQPVILASTSDRGQYDTEIVLRSVRSALRIVEVPMPHVEVRPPRAVIVAKVAWNIVALLRLWRKMRHLPFAGEMRYHRFAREDVMAEAIPELAHIVPASGKRGSLSSKAELTTA